MKEEKKYVINFDEMKDDKTWTPRFYEEMRRDENGKIICYVVKRWPKKG